MKERYIQKVLPDPSLREYIRQYTFIDFPFDLARHIEFKVLPSCHTRMILFLGKPSLQVLEESTEHVHRFSLTGFISRPQLYLPADRLRQVLIHFTTCGVQPFINFPLSEITDSHVNLEDIFSYSLEDLVAKLQTDMTPERKASSLDGFFLKQRLITDKIDRRADKIARLILQTHGTVKLKVLAQQLFMGERTLQRLVHTATGINFKFLSKLARMQYVRQLLAEQQSNLTSVALKAGFFDQAHFIHEFRETFNENPGEYLKRQKKLVWNQIDVQSSRPDIRI